MATLPATVTASATIPTTNLSFLGSVNSFAPTYASTPEPRKMAAAGRRSSVTVTTAQDTVPPPVISTAGSGGTVPPTTKTSKAPSPESPTKQTGDPFTGAEVGPTATALLLEEDAEALDVTNYTG